MFGRFLLAPTCFALSLLCTTGFASSAVAQPISPKYSAAERSQLAEAFLTEKLWVWKNRLNLQTWNISVVVSHPTDLKPKTLGNIHWDNDKKTATIRVLDPADYQIPFSQILQDMEFTVVHELIHLELAPVLSQFSRNDANRRDEEHAVNDMADALLKLERGH